jgi:hypothetical protein
MAIVYTWKILQMDRNVADDGVVVAHWSCLGKDEVTENTDRVYGSVSFTPNPESPDFIPYENLTEEIVLGWLWNGKIDKQEYENVVAATIQTLNNPPTVSGLPW